MTKNEIKLRAALESIKAAAEQHPCFAGYQPDVSYTDVASDGGDIAFVTLDIARVAKEALE